MTSRRDYLGLSYFIHPWPLFAVAVLLFNDHWLKANYPSWLSGKLSDFAGLFYFPLFLCALYALVASPFARELRWITPRRLLVAMLVTDAVFIALKLSPQAAAAWSAGLRALGFAHAQVVSDPTDLVALLSGALVFWFARPFWRATGR